MMGMYEPRVGQARLADLFAHIAESQAPVRAQELAHASGLSLTKAEFALALMEIQGWVAEGRRGYMVTAKGRERKEALAR